MKYVRKYWREAVCVLLFSGLGGCVSLLINGGKTAKIIAAVLAVADVVALVLLVRLLWRIKWKKALVRGLQKAFEALSKFFLKVSDAVMRRLGKYRKNTLYGNARITYYGSAERRGKKAARKTVKWKQLDSTRERLGFLYRYMIGKRISEGARARASDTPCELKKSISSSVEQDELFELYIGARYDERFEVSDAQLDSLKLRLDAPDKIK